MRYVLLLFIFGCSAPDFSTDFSWESETGCKSRWSTPGDECGPVVEWSVRCTVPLMSPGAPNTKPCVSPNDGKWSTVWCCPKLDP